MPINDFKAISTFAKAVELGSIRQAALAQGVTPQAASQAIAQLEQHLGVRLLHRTTRSLALTEEGQRFLENTQPALAALDRALAQARESKDEIAGPLRIVGPKSSFAAVLIPLLEEPSKSERPVSEKNPTFRGAPRRDVEAVHHRLSRRGASPLQRGHVKRPLNRFPVSPRNISRDREHGYSVTSGPA